MKIKTISKYITGEQSSISKTLKHARKLNRLRKSIDKMLPIELAMHCRFAEIKENEAVFLADSSAWASRLRLHKMMILPLFKKHQYTINDSTPITKLKVKVIPPEQKKQTTIQNDEMYISTETSILLRSCAGHVSNQRLKDALKSLSHR